MAPCASASRFVMICIYKVDNIRAHGTNPLTSHLDNSPFAWRTLPCSQVPLTCMESLLCVWCDPCPLWSQVACKLTSSPSPLSLPNLPSGSSTVPHSNCVPFYDNITTSHSPVQDRFFFSYVKTCFYISTGRADSHCFFLTPIFDIPMVRILNPNSIVKKFV
jgi:hypothetical protein